MEIKVKKVHPDAIIPSYAHEYDAGMDLYTTNDYSLEPGEKIAAKTGIAIALPNDHVGLIWDKSGLGIKQGLKVLGGVIDPTYRGEIMVGIINLSQSNYTLQKGDKVAQILIQPIVRPSLKEVQTLSDTSRGEDGFGSTGK